MIFCGDIQFSPLHFIHSLHPAHAAVNTKNNRTNLLFFPRVDTVTLSVAIIFQFLMSLICMIYLVPQMQWKRKQDAQQGL